MFYCHFTYLESNKAVRKLPGDWADTQLEIYGEYGVHRTKLIFLLRVLYTLVGGYHKQRNCALSRGEISEFAVGMAVNEVLTAINTPNQHKQWKLGSN